MADSLFNLALNITRLQQNVLMFSGNSWIQDIAGIQNEVNGLYLKPSHSVTIDGGLIVEENTTLTGSLQLNSTATITGTLTVTADISAANFITSDGANLNVVKTDLTAAQARIEDLSGEINSLSVSLASNSVQTTGDHTMEGVLDVSAIIVRNNLFFKDDGGECQIQWNDTQLEFKGNGGNLNLLCQTVETSSDVRLKEDIVPILNSKELIQQLKPVYWKWKKNNKKSCGFIAQDIMKVSPDAVGGNEDNLALNYNYFIGLLISRVQEMEKEIQLFRK